MAPTLWYLTSSQWSVAPFPGQDSNLRSSSSEFSTAEIQGACLPRGWIRTSDPLPHEDALTTMPPGIKLSERGSNPRHPGYFWNLPSCTAILMFPQPGVLPLNYPRSSLFFSKSECRPSSTSLWHRLQTNTHLVNSALTASHDLVTPPCPIPNDLSPRW